MAKRYFWLKLKEDFFNQPEIGILERGKRGREVLLFYLKILTLAIGTEGRLRISEAVPYDIPDLAAVTGNTVPLATLAVERLKSLNLLIQEEDGTYFLPRVMEMQGTESYWAQKKREQKEKQRLDDFENVGNFPKKSNEFPTSPSKSIEKEIEKEKESEIEKERKGAVVVGEGQDGTDLWVELSLEQRKILVDQMGYDRLVGYLEKMDAFTESKGRAFKDPYQTILKWYQEDCG